jgi:hypothetical protein
MVQPEFITLDEIRRWNNANYRHYRCNKKSTLVLNSTDKLHENGGSLAIHRVAIHADKVNQYASLVSLGAFSVIAGKGSV